MGSPNLLSTRFRRWELYPNNFIMDCVTTIQDRHDVMFENTFEKSDFDIPVIFYDTNHFEEFLKIIGKHAFQKSDLDRNTMIFKMAYEKQMQYKEIAEELNMQNSSVSYIIQKYLDVASDVLYLMYYYPEVQEVLDEQKKITEELNKFASKNF